MSCINQTPNLTGLRLALTLIIFMAFYSPRMLMAEALKTDAPGFIRSTAMYKVPDITMLRQDGEKLAFLKELDDGRPVILSFVFVSCSAICPMLNHLISKVQSRLDKDGQKVHFISISIDPESDSPAQLTEYAKKIGAGRDWDFYTGTREASVALQKTFNAYRGDKMNHIPVMFMRAEPGKAWLRLEGFLSPDTVINEYLML